MRAPRTGATVRGANFDVVNQRLRQVANKGGLVLTRKSYPGAAPRRKLDVRQLSGPEPVWASEAGYRYVQADAETDMLMSLRAGLQAQLEGLDAFIVERLEAKLAATRRS